MAKILHNRISYFAYLFLISATIQCASLIYLMPPFQGADELNHTYRAAAISSGHLLSEMTAEGQPGGKIDKRIGEAAATVEYLAFKPEAKYRSDARAAAHAIQWSGSSSLYPYPNTAINSPLFYVPSALGIAIGRLSGFSIVDSSTIARCLNAVSYIIVGFFAVLFAGRAAPTLFILLTLPMAVSLGSYVTQDGLVTASLALAGSLLMQSQQQSAKSANVIFLLAVLLMLLSALAKAPYVILIPPLLFFSPISVNQRIPAVSGAIATAVIWHIYVAKALPVIWPFNPADQISALLHDPLRVIPIAINTVLTLGQGYLHQMIGVLGWLDAPVPDWFAGCAVIVLVFGFIMCCTGTTEKPTPLFASTMMIAMIGSIGLVFGSMYLVWTKTGADIVDGVQGRYFLPLLVMLPPSLVLSHVRWNAWSLSFREWPIKIILAFYSALTVLVTITTVSARYYDGIFE